MYCDSLSSDFIGREIKAINHIIHRKMLADAAKAGVDKVTIMHGWIIGYLYDHKDTDVFQKDLESGFAISRSTVTNILKLMEKKEYIKRVSVESDARLKKIVLTPKGEQTNLILKKTIDKNESRINSLLSDDERKTFINLIGKLRSGLENS